MTLALARRSVHVHVNRACNLRCAHCYSSSGPHHREELPLEPLADWLRAARADGYEVVSFSGGEPFLYGDLAPALDLCRELGFGTSIVTNGTIFGARQRRAALSQLDFVAVSVDGPEEVHNALRRSSTAFAGLRQGLDAIRASGTRLGIVHTVTADSLPHLPWLAEFAAGQGAELLQLHPLGLVGAAEANGLSQLDGATLTRAHLVAAALRSSYAGRMKIHLDLFNREILRHDLGLIVPPDLRDAPGGPGQPGLSELVNPLVVMSNGDVSPICHGMHPLYRLGNIGRESYAEMAEAHRVGGHDRLRQLVLSLWSRMSRSEGWPYFNWYELLEQCSTEEPAPSLAPAADSALQPTTHLH